MARQRVIAGIGEALLAEFPDREEPAGLALLVPIYAGLIGHVGIPISRLGQDEPARQLIAQLRARGIDTSHLQSDPDLATGRLIHRAGGPVIGLDAYVAFDNLQWDFDLTDVAQRVDAVIFSALARRSAQARSACDRFLAQCHLAVRVFDLTNRPDPQVDRGNAMSVLKYTQAIVIDESGLGSWLPSPAGRPAAKIAQDLIREGELSFLLLAEPDKPLTLFTAESSWTSQQKYCREMHAACLVGLLHGLLAGWEMRRALELAERFGRHTVEEPGKPAPEALLSP